MPTVSIIIPAHNEEKHIERCLQSLINQDYKDIEIIVVDNGSRDKTPDIVRNYAERYPDMIRLLRLEKNLGIGGGRNIGAMKASGDILVTVDADMIFPPDYVRKLVSPIEREEALLTTHSTEYVANTDNPWVKVQGQTSRAQLRRTEGQFRAIKKDFFIRYGGLDPGFQYHADRTFFYKTGAKALVVEDAYCYHNNPDTAKEIFRRNYWIGRTFLAVMHHENGMKGIIRASTITLARSVDLIALPSAVACIALQPLPPVATTLLLIPPSIFTALTLRMKIIRAESVSERLKLRLIYAPAYRFIRAAGLIAGVVMSLLRGLRVRPQKLNDMTGENPV